MKDAIKITKALVAEGFVLPKNQREPIRCFLRGI